MRKENTKIKTVASIISSVFVSGAAITLFIFSMQGKTVEDVKKDVEKIVEKHDSNNDDDNNDSTSENELEHLIYNKLCICDFAADKYSNWESSGYMIAPKEEYDINNINFEEKDVYGVPLAQQSYYNEAGMTEYSYIEENVKKAPDYAVEGNEFKTSVYSKDCVKKINEEFCLPFVISNAKVTKINITDKIDITNKDNISPVVNPDEFYTVVDKTTGKISESSNLCCLEIELQVECHCPWVTYFNITPVMDFYRDRGEYIEFYDVMQELGSSDAQIGWGGSPIYSETYKKGKFYPITAGNTYKFKYAYIVDKAYLENAYIEFWGFSDYSYGARYYHLLKITE